jgi:phosphomannomutase/phosphoglucomutase
MVTASHNPASDNGFKLIQGKQALSPEAIQQLYQIIQKESFIKGKGWFGWDREVVALYTKKLKTIFPSLEKKKIVLDCGNAVAGEIAPKIFSELGCNVIPLFCNADGNFPNRDPDPSNPDHLAALSQKIKEVNADVGFALDGDADRLFIVDEDGKPVTADHLIMLFAKSVIEKQKKAEVVVGSKCSNLIKQYVANLSGECHFAKTGHTAIKEKMQETDALFGTEASGHFIFKDTWYGFDDGLFAAARLLELLSRNRKTVSQLVTELPQSVITPEIRVVVSDKEKEKIISRLISEAEAIDAEKNYLDGLRLEYPFGWGIVRASNTAACLTLRFEADTQDNLEVIQQQFRELLKTEKLFF